MINAEAVANEIKKSAPYTFGMPAVVVSLVVYAIVWGTWAIVN